MTEQKIKSIVKNYLIEYLYNGEQPAELTPFDNEIIKETFKEIRNYLSFNVINKNLIEKITDETLISAMNNQW